MRSIVVSVVRSFFNAAPYIRILVFSGGVDAKRDVPFLFRLTIVSVSSRRHSFRVAMVSSCERVVPADRVAVFSIDVAELLSCSGIIPECYRSIACCLCVFTVCK